MWTHCDVIHALNLHFGIDTRSGSCMRCVHFSQICLKQLWVPLPIKRFIFVLAYEVAGCNSRGVQVVALPMCKTQNLKVWRDFYTCAQLDSRSQPPKWLCYRKVCKNSSLWTTISVIYAFIWHIMLCYSQYRNMLLFEFAQFIGT